MSLELPYYLQHVKDSTPKAGGKAKTDNNINFNNLHGNYDI